MGTSESKQTNLPFMSLFSNEEKEQIKRLFNKISGGKPTFDRNQVKNFCPRWFDSKLSEGIPTALFSCHNNRTHHHRKTDREFDEVQLCGFLAQILKGTYGEKCDILCNLCGGSETLLDVGICSLNQVVCAIIKSGIELSKKHENHKSWQINCTEHDISRLSLYLLSEHDKEFSLVDDARWSLDQLEGWFSKSPLFVKVFDGIFQAVFRITSHGTKQQQFLLPLVTNVNWNKVSTILDIPSVAFLNYHLPSPLQTEWRLLYSNRLYGDSFSQLVSHMMKKGPSVLIVRDKDGHVFGGFASESWDVRPQFAGSSNCFLFHLLPQYGVYTATGYNDHFMYLNQGVQTLPNGLGMGGQLDYFGLWIDQSFNHGHSKAVPKCTTYGSPQLSGKAEFEVDTIEVWAVGPDQKKEDEDEAITEAGKEFKKTSILDKDASARAILTMAGKGPVSDGVREAGEEEKMTEEMKRKMNTIPKLL